MENTNKESFVSLYTRLYNENFDELEKLREKERKSSIKIILLTLAVILTFAIFPPIGIPLFIIFIIIMIRKSIKNIKRTTVITNTTTINGKVVSKQIVEEGEKSYKLIFKEKIVTPIIQNVFTDSNYYPISGISSAEYNRGDWERYDVYDSEDKIVTKIIIGEHDSIETSLVISEVHTQDRREDSDGDTHYVTLFHGLAGHVNLPKDIGCYIKIINNKINLFGKSKDNVQMDMSEFEKMFDVEANDKIKAMQLLTADVMSELIEVVNKSKVKFEMNIRNNMLYIRFHTGEMFEPSVFGRSMQLDMLRKYFDIITSVKNITERICSIIQNTEI